MISVGASHPTTSASNKRRLVLYINISDMEQSEAELYVNDTISTLTTPDPNTGEVFIQPSEFLVTIPVVEGPTRLEIVP